MKKLFIFLILVLILVSSCTTGKTAVDTEQEVQEPVEEEPEIEIPPEPYCGDEICQETETAYNCSGDCGEPYSFSQLTDDINTVFNEDWIFSEDKLSSTDKVKYYKSHRVTISEILKEEDYIYSFEDFKEFIDEQTKIAVEGWVEAARNSSNENGYAFDYEQKNEEIDLGVGTAIDSIYIFRYYKIYRVKDDVTKEYKNITKFDFPEVDQILKIWCTPEFIVKLRKDPNWGVSVNWNNLPEMDREPTISNYLSDSRDSSIDVAKDIIEKCKSVDT